MGDFSDVVRHLQTEALVLVVVIRAPGYRRRRNRRRRNEGVWMSLLCRRRGREVRRGGKEKEGER